MNPQLKKRIVIGVLAFLVVLALLFFAVYKIGGNSCSKACNKKIADQKGIYDKKLTDYDKVLSDQKKDCNKRITELNEACEKTKKVEKKVEKRVMKKVVAKKPVVKSPPVVGDIPVRAPAPSPAVALAPVPVPTPAQTGIVKEGGYTIRLNVVECNPQYIGADFSRNIGPFIRGGMANGTILRTTKVVTFKVEFRKGGTRLAGKNVFINGELKSLPANFADGWSVEVATRNGQATISVDPALIWEETELSVQPQGVQMTAPPNGLPLTTNRGELRRQVDAGVQETFLHFILPLPKS